MGDAARGAIAIGMTEATGSLLETTKQLMDSDRATIRALLDQSVPWFLRWAKEFILLFL